MSPGKSFSAADFVVLGLSFVISSFIGIYHACDGKKQDNRETYFLGDRKISVIPISLSLMATKISAVSFLGLPAEVYFFGPDLLITIPGRALSLFILSGTVFPLFHKLELTSIYEYLEMRFNKTVKIAGVCVHLAFFLCYMGFVVYAPALALSLVTGMSVVSSSLLVTIVCIFYTTIGGIKAVIWTDVFQSFLMLSGLFAIMIAAIVEVDGIREAAKRISDGERLPSINLSFDFSVRYTLYSSLCGGFFMSYTMFTTQQHMIQRYLCCRSLKHVKGVAWIAFLFAEILSFICVLAGLATYAYYAGCDPFLSGRIKRFDQIIPLIISDLFAQYPGLAGLLVSGAFSASLSSISSGLNSLSAILDAVLLRKVFPNATDKKLTFFSKVSSVGFGLLCTVAALLATKLSGVFEETLVLFGIIMTPLSAVFTLGFFVPRCNSKGAMSALTVGIAFGVWIKIGSELYPTPSQPPILSIDNCPEDGDINATSAGLDINYMTTQMAYVTSLDPSVEVVPRSTFAALYNMSVFFYSVFTFLVSMLVGYIVSLFTRPPPSMDSRLYSSLLDVFLFRGDGSMSCTSADPPDEANEDVEMNEATDDVIDVDATQ